jgi:hypothetical protein
MVASAGPARADHFDLPGAVVLAVTRDSGYNEHVRTDRTDRMSVQEARRSHEVLLTMARKLRAAAQDRDGRRFSRESHRFLDELATHLAGEAHDLSGLPDASRLELAEGQHRLMELAQVLALGDPDISLDPSAEELLALLQWQRERERRAHVLGPLGDRLAA